MPTDARIAADIEALREQCEDTRTLYREVCALLFFRYGITPTANRLYQYVRKGSMGTPTEVLAKFWEELRDRARVRIDRPDLPQELRDAAGALVHDLWIRSQAAAEQSVTARRKDADDLVERANEASRQAHLSLASERERHADTRRALEDSRAMAMDLNRQLATVQGRLASMSDLIRENAREMLVLRTDLADVQRDVARAVGEGNALRVQLVIAKRRRPGKPLGGVPADPDVGQEVLELDRVPSPEHGPGGEAPEQGAIPV